MATELLEGLIRGPGAAVARLQMDVAAYPELLGIPRSRYSPGEARPERWCCE